MVAYHEAGHAVVTQVLVRGKLPYKLSIVGTGGVLGYQWYASEQDRSIHSRSDYNDLLASWLGGRVAEQIVFGEPGSAGADDLERVRETARQVVADLGLGPSGALPGADRDRSRNSEKLAQQIDADAKIVIDAAEAAAGRVLTEHRAALDRIAEALIDQETVYGEEIERMMTATA